MTHFVDFCNQVCALAVEAETYASELGDLVAETKHVVRYAYDGGKPIATGDEWIAQVVDWSLSSEPITVAHGRGKDEEGAKEALKLALLKRIDAKRRLVG